MPRQYKTKIQPGMVFGRLKVVRRVPSARNPRWECVCACGQTTSVYGQNLTCRRVKSCGCLREEYLEARRKDRIYANGYAFIKDPSHPRAHPQTGRVREHIVVMESILGRSLLPGEEVHHKNGVKDDNSEGNLELWLKSQPAGQRVADQVEWATAILQLYAPETLKRRKTR